MTQEAHELLQKALALPESERAELAGNLISSLDTTVDPDVDAAWQQEIARRPILFNQSRRVPAKLLLFPDEGHWVLKPQNTVLWYATFLDWIGQWTKPQ